MILWKAQIIIFRPLGLIILFCLFPVWVLAQTVSVTGVVKDASGEPIIGASVLEKGVQVRGDERVCALNDQVIPATEEDWGTEYLDSIISVKTVDSFDEAVAHINHYIRGIRKRSSQILTRMHRNS